MNALQCRLPKMMMRIHKARRDDLACAVKYPSTLRRLDVLCDAVDKTVFGEEVGVSRLDVVVLVMDEQSASLEEKLA